MRRKWNDIETKVISFATSGVVTAEATNIMARNGAHLTTLEQQLITLAIGAAVAYRIRSRPPVVVPEPASAVDVPATPKGA